MKGHAPDTVPRSRPLRAAYPRGGLVDLGAFLPGERLELVSGALLVREPQTPPDATVVGLVEDALREALEDYWIVNLVDQVLEVYREPIADPHERYGHRYATAVTLRGEERVTPLSAPHASIPITDLLP